MTERCQMINMLFTETLTWLTLPDDCLHYRAERGLPGSSTTSPSSGFPTTASVSPCPGAATIPTSPMETPASPSQTCWREDPPRGNSCEQREAETGRSVDCFSFRINDRVISANSSSLEGVDYATAVQVLRDSGHSVNLVVKRRVVLPSPPEPQTVKVSLYKNKKKEDFGIVLGCKIYIKEISSRSVADKDGNLQDGDILQKINNVSLDGLSLKEARKLLDAAKDRLGESSSLLSVHHMTKFHSV